MNLDKFRPVDHPVNESEYEDSYVARQALQ